MRNMTAEKAATEIYRAYDSYTTGHNTIGEWASIEQLMDRMDLTVAEFTAGALHLLNTNDRFNITPEPNRRMITPGQHACAIRVGGQDNHLVIWA